MLDIPTISAAVAAISVVAGVMEEIASLLRGDIFFKTLVFSILMSL